MKALNTLTNNVLRQYIGVIALLLAGAVSLAAQDAIITVNGTVTDNEENSPLVGVTVIVKGQTTGAVTDIDGKYSISAPANGVLVFSYIGMESQEVSIGGRTTIDLAMTPDVVGFDEVVVVGYGTQKKENLSGAVDAIDVAQLESRPINNIAQGLQGLAPNLNIGFNSGAPGQAATFNIRGFTSINGGEPLILIDNVPVDPIELNRIAPQDVAKISVIKDASAAAIYGARASFGVVLITTKNGNQDRAQVSYTNNLSFSTPTILTNRITDPYIFLRQKEDASNNTPWDNQNFTDEQYQWARERSDNPNSTPGVRENANSGLWEYMGDRDWVSYFLDDYSFSQDHNLSISGSSNSADYYLSGGYNRYNGALTLADDYFDRYSVRGKVNFRVNDWLTLGNNTFLSSTLRKRPSYYSIWDIYNMDPVSYDINPDGTWANSEVGIESAQLTDGGDSEQDYNSYQTTFSGEIKLIRDILKVNAEYTARRGTGNWDWYQTKYLIGYGPGDVRETGTNRAYREMTNERYDVVNVYGTFFNRLAGDHQITAIAGFNQEYYRYDNFFADREGLISASLPSISLATGEDEVGENVFEWALRGVFGRLNYIYKDKYIIEFNGRYDGSSRFPSDSRFGFFPSASAAWRIDKEGFFNVPAVSLLKLRASYGELGNQSVNEYYGYIPSMSAAAGRYIIGGQIPQRIIPPALVSSNYSWENVQTTNFGIDLGLFENRLTVNFDIFRRNTLGMLTLGKDLPDVLGASEPRENAADLETKGWDLSVEYRNTVEVAGKPLGFNIKGILSDSRSFITRFDNPDNRLTQFYEGMELGEIWGLESDGLFQTQAEIDALDQSPIIPWGALPIVLGWPKYIDQNGDGVINKGSLTVDDPGDLKVIGNFMPRLQFGVNLGADWNGFDFNVFLQGIAQRDYYPVDYLYWSFYQQPYEGGAVHTLDYYRANEDSPERIAQHSQAYIDAGLAEQNLDAAFPHIQAWLADRNLGERVDQSQGLAIPQTGHLLNASYLRVKNLTVGYTLPETLTQRINIARFRIFVSGENLAEWSGVKEFYDPEAITDAVQNRFNPAVGAGRGTGSGYQYPFQRRYAFGINVTF